MLKLFIDVRQIVLPLILIIIHTASASQSSLKSKTSHCQNIPSKLEAPYERDDFRMTCFITTNRSYFTQQTCLQAATQMENLTYRDQLLSYCIRTLKVKLTASECQSLALKIHFSDTRDDSMMECLDAVKNSPKLCLQTASLMVLPHSKKLAYGMCSQ